MSGRMRLWPSATTVAESMRWQNCSVFCEPTWRVEHWPQWMESEAWIWMASRATRRRPSRRRKGSRTVSRQRRKRFGEVFGVVTVEEISDLTVTRNHAGTEEGVAVGAGGLHVHAALEVEKGGGLEEEAGEGAGSAIGDGVALAGAGAGVGQGGCDPAEVVQKGIEHWKTRNGGRISCLGAVPAMLSPQKLVPCCHPSAARETPKGQI